MSFRLLLLIHTNFLLASWRSTGLSILFIRVNWSKRSTNCLNILKAAPRWSVSTCSHHYNIIAWILEIKWLSACPQKASLFPGFNTPQITQTRPGVVRVGPRTWGWQAEGWDRQRMLCHSNGCTGHMAVDSVDHVWHEHSWFVLEKTESRTLPIWITTESLPSKSIKLVSRTAKDSQRKTASITAYLLKLIGCSTIFQKLRLNTSQPGSARTWPFCDLATMRPQQITNGLPLRIQGQKYVVQRDVALLHPAMAWGIAETNDECASWKCGWSMILMGGTS